VFLRLELLFFMEGHMQHHSSQQLPVSPAILSALFLHAESLTQLHTLARKHVLLVTEGTRRAIAGLDDNTISSFIWSLSPKKLASIADLGMENPVE
jgi:hypothetical protein